VEDPLVKPKELFMAPKRRKTAKRKAAKRKTSRRKSPLSQIQYNLSPELAEIVGSKRSTRPQVTKKIWHYIKARKLQDSKNRRVICPDKKLAEVLGSRPIDMFKMTSVLNKHIRKG
jgi:chromatin remodeling complex protein RSC6